jgi:hypothetical protein
VSSKILVANLKGKTQSGKIKVYFQKSFQVQGSCVFFVINYKLLVGKPEGKSSLRRPRCRWVNNIRMDLGEVGWGDVDWIGLAQDRGRWRALVNSVLNLRIP